MKRLLTIMLVAATGLVVAACGSPAAERTGARSGGAAEQRAPTAGDTSALRSAESSPEPHEFPGTEVRYSNGWGDDWFQFGLEQGSTENRGPLTLAVRDNGETYVLDTIKRRVMVFRPDGTMLRTFHADTEKAAGLAVTSDGYVLLDNFDKNRSASVYGPDGDLIIELPLPSDVLVSTLKVSGTQVWARGLVEGRAIEGLISDYVLVWEDGAPAATQTRSLRLPMMLGAVKADVRFDSSGRVAYEVESGGQVSTGTLPGSDDHGMCEWRVTDAGDLIVASGRTGAPSLGWDVWKVTPAGAVLGPEHIDSPEWTYMSKPIAASADGSLYLLSSRPDAAVVSRVRIAWSDQPGPLRPLTYGTGSNSFPVVEGDWAAWIRRGDAGSQLYMCRLPDGSPFPVGEVTQSAGELVLDNGRLAWEAWDGEHQQIYLFDTASGVMRKLTDEPIDRISPRISGDRMMWIERGESPDIWRVMLLDLATDTRTELAKGSLYGAYVEDDWAVWSLGSPTPGEEAQIYLRDLVSGSTLEIPSGSPFNQSPQVADGIVTWLGDSGGLGRDDVYAYSIASGSSTLLTHDIVGTFGVVVGGGRVAWGAQGLYDRNGAEYYAWDSGSGSTSRLTYDPFNKGRLRLDGDWLAWEQGSSASRRAVFLHHLPTNTTLRVGAPERQIYQAEATDPSLSSGHLVWTQGDSAGSNIMLYSFSPDEAPDPGPQPFSDILGSPYLEAVTVLAGKGIVAGMADGLFHPEGPVNRAQLAKMLVELLAIPMAPGAETPFWDIGEDDPAEPYPYEYVAAAYAAGIARGTGTHSFSPWQPISRAQLVTLIVRAADQRQIPLASWIPPEFHPTLGDFDPTHGHAMTRAEFDGLLSDLPDFGPDWDPWAPATRGEAASLLRNLLWNWTNR